MRAAINGMARRSEGLWRDQRGSTLPLIMAILFVLVLFIFAALAIAEIAVERTRQQASADLAALAGANALAKSMETARAIDGTVWARNVTLDAMYLAATVVTIGSAGAGAEAFAIPLRFQQATIKPVEALEKMKTGVAKVAVVYAVAGSAGIVKANGPNDLGAAIPFPLVAGEDIMSQRQQDLSKMVRVYDRRVDQAKGEMDEALQAYEKKKAAVTREGQGDRDIKRNPEVEKLLKKVRETSGRVGGLTTQRNRRRNELSRLKKIRPFTVGSDGVVAVVYHPSSHIPFSSALGGISTKNNVAVAAATMQDAPATETIGDQTVHRLFSGLPLGDRAAGGIDGITDAINILGTGARQMPRKYGVIGRYLHGALDKLGLIPPPLNQVRPVLTSADKVVGESVPGLTLLNETISTSRRLGTEFGVEIE